MANVFNEYIEEFAYKVFQLRPQKLKLKLYMSCKNTQCFPLLIQFKCIISSFMRFAKVIFYKKDPHVFYNFGPA